MSHVTLVGYEVAGFFGRNCHPCLRSEDKTPYEAARALAGILDGSYIIEEESGWTVYSPDEPKLSAEDERALKVWLDTPVEEHIARWKAEIQKGLRNDTGRWIGPDRSQR